MRLSKGVASTPLNLLNKIGGKKQTQEFLGKFGFMMSFEFFCFWKKEKKYFWEFLGMFGISSIASTQGAAAAASEAPVCSVIPGLFERCQAEE